MRPSKFALSLVSITALAALLGPTATPAVAVTGEDAAREELDTAKDAADAAKSAFDDAKRMAANARRTHDQAIARLQRATNDMHEALANVETAKASLAELASAAQQFGGSWWQITVVFEADTADDLVWQTARISQALHAQDQRVAQAQVAYVELANQHATLRGELFVAETALNTSEEVVGEARDRNARAQKAVADAKAALQDAQRANADGSFAGAVRLQLPTSAPVTSPFGMRTHPVLGVRKLHTGTDFGARCGDRARVAAEGTVTEATNDSAYGLRVGVRHDGFGSKDVVTTYNHLSRIDVSVGDQLSAGQPVGLVGTTGLSTGCHLHFEVVLDGQFTDPMQWLTDP